MTKAARDRLRAAMRRHERGDIAGAVEEARAALVLAPGFADARSYLGSTLITRLGRYEEGLAELERARDDAPDDPAVHYTLGWCCEFVAHALSRRRRQRGALDPADLYAKAEASLRRCLELRPEGKMIDDAKDLLSSIIKEDVE
jgi:tetratricopeptide (TPR) repeat protein